ncbi:GNAT family N-acetyltransferase [Alteribacillus sp. JSM 102045]|uniref:GNAT family N-acetyltransferase n=1 Tax=Alteribacillus sp. JSM 102045 TaxID=1562101 RepID=UPI0035BEFF84
MLVAEVGKVIAGFANLSQSGRAKEYEISALYLLPDYQNQGIGKMLLNELVDMVPQGQTITLIVERDNKKGKIFMKPTVLRSQKNSRSVLQALRCGLMRLFVK